MKYFLAKNEEVKENAIVADDMFLTTKYPTTAGSKMLEGYMSLFNAEVIDRLEKAGYFISGKANVGELGIDFLGETSYFGMCKDKDEKIVGAINYIVEGSDTKAGITLDVNGAPRRGASLSNQICLKPTYGCISRFGTIPSVCSGETVSITTKNIENLKEVLDVIVGHDDKDGTSLPEDKCMLLRNETESENIKKIAILKNFTQNVDEDTKNKINDVMEILKANSIEVKEIDEELFEKARIAWNILMSSELCNNVSRYDGVKYGYRAKDYTTIEELYTRSRTEAFGDLLKTTIIYGSENLSTDNYMKVYDKALRTRRVISEKFEELFKEYDAIIMPTTSKSSYTEEDIANNKYIAFDENLYTAPASITGLPVLVASGIQFVSKQFNENLLLEIGKLICKEVR